MIGEAASARTARDANARLAPDIVLLDVEMPAEDGFAAVAPDDELPVFVFVTAHAAHAVRAFEVRALEKCAHLIARSCRRHGGPAGCSRRDRHRGPDGGIVGAWPRSSGDHIRSTTSRSATM